MKVMALLFFLFLSSFAYGADEISFKDLYRYDVLVKMRKELPHGKCMDMRAHFLKSIQYIGANIRESDWQNRSRTKKAARSYCASSKDNPLCDSLDGFISYRKAGKKGKYLQQENIQSVSESNGKKDSAKSCRENVEAGLAHKFHDVIMAKVYDEDTGIASKAMHKYDAYLDGGDSPLEDFNQDCNDEMKYASIVLLEEFKSSVHGGCLESLRKKGLSVYDKKEIYCSGKTPLACSLYKRAPASEKD